MKREKVVLVGTGFVGMSMAYSMLNRGGISELVLIDIDQDILAQLKSSFIIKDKNGKYSFNTRYHSEQKMDVSLTYDGVGGTDPKKLSIKNYN